MPLLQSAENSTRKRGPGDRGSVSLKTTLDQPTKPNSLIIAVAFVTGGVKMGLGLSGATGFTQIVNTALRDTQLVIWYKQAAAPLSSLTVSIDAYRGVVFRIFEYNGIALSNALDKITINAQENDDPNSGSTSTLAASGELVFGVVGNQYTNGQHGFSGGLSELFETVTPDDSREDWERGRVTFHQTYAADTSARRLTTSLTTSRRWIAVLLTFRPGTAGPARFTSTNQTSLIVDRNKANLTVFGPLKVTLTANRTALSSVEVVQARIGPFDYQYRLGGWGGLLIGAGTNYPIESVEGLEGWTARTSDDDIPRGDGALRGIDLQTARQIIFKLSAGSKAALRSATEANLAALYNALVMQRDQDVELIFRHPGRPLRTIYYRPTNILRTLDLEGALAAKQAFTLRAADPRHYSAVTHRIAVPVANDDSDIVNIVAATNIGNARAYPVIRFVSAATQDISRISLFNASTATSFEIEAVIPSKAEVIGDMRARVTGGAASVVTLNGQTKYGSWQLPRDPFFIAPDPEAALGVNLLYARTVPTGSPVTVTLDYRDTWSG